MTHMSHTPHWVIRGKLDHGFFFHQHLSGVEAAINEYSERALQAIYSIQWTLRNCAKVESLKSPNSRYIIYVLLEKRGIEFQVHWRSLIPRCRLSTRRGSHYCLTMANISKSGHASERCSLLNGIYDCLSCCLC